MTTPRATVTIHTRPTAAQRVEIERDRLRYGVVVTETTGDASAFVTLDGLTFPRWQIDEPLWGMVPEAVRVERVEGDRTVLRGRH